MFYRVLNTPLRVVSNIRKLVIVRQGKVKNMAAVFMVQGFTYILLFNKTIKMAFGENSLKNKFLNISSFILENLAILLKFRIKYELNLTIQ